MAQVVRRLLLVREVWGSNPEPIKSPTLCERLATAATFEVWALTQSRGDGHRSFVTPERVLSEYNEDLIFVNEKKSMFLHVLCRFFHCKKADFVFNKRYSKVVLVMYINRI